MAKISNIMLALGVAISVMAGRAGTSQALPFHPGERVALFGDSITHMGNYIQYLQLWENLRHPGSGVRFMNCGIAGDTARKGLERFDADLLPMKPDRVFVMFGMNDVGRDDYATTSPSDAQRAARAKSLEGYATNMKAVVEKLAASGMETVLMTPTPYDQYTKAKGENLVECNEPGLASCADIVRDIAAKRGLELVELHRPMTEMFKGNLDFRFCPDRVHPGKEGHLVIAAQILKSLGASPLVARAEVDASSLTVRDVDNAKVTDVAKSEDGMSFTYAPRSLPFPALPEYLTVEDKGFFSVADALNREVIAVVGLEAGEYELVFDGKAVARFSSDELAHGVNVATLDTENQRRAQKAARPMGELREKVSLLRDYALMVNMAVKSGVPESDHPRMDAYFDRWLKDTASSRYHSTFRMWVKNYHDVCARKGEIEARTEQLRAEMSAARPAVERVGVRRLKARSSSAVGWDFPRTGHCHEGMAFSDGVTGILVWGGGDTVNLTLGRADMWDHRGGYPWTDEQSYTNIVSAVCSGDKNRLHGLFAKNTPKGEPRNPYMLPLGRVIVKIPGAELKHGELDPFTGTAWIDFVHEGEMKRLEAAMCKWGGGLFSIGFPNGVHFQADVVPAMETPNVRNVLEPIGFSDAEKWHNDKFGAFGAGESCGFSWNLPSDRPVSVLWWRSGRDMFVRTERSLNKSPFLTWGGPVPTFEIVRKEAVAHWKAFWAEGARVNVPDPVVQRMFDYGMYRFGAMTDPDGIPAGLQGPWLEDDALVPWNGDYHFNINVQECYSPAYRGGHFKDLMPLFRMVLSWRSRLRENARKFAGIDDGYVLPHSVDDRGVCIGGFWTGTTDHASTAWVAAMMMKYVRYSGDVEFLRSDAYDFMKGAMNVYRVMMEEREGRLSIPLGPSPEWGGADVKKAVGRDPSFQLAAAHKLARDLIDAAALLGEKPDPMWLDVERRLPEYTADESGIVLFEGQRFSESHRHHSHMAGLYPFDTIDLADFASRSAADMTYSTWMSKGTGAWTGWCVPWASILHTHFGNASEAVRMLHAWDMYFCDDGHGSHHDAVRPGFSKMMMAGRQTVMQMDGQCAAVTAVMELMVHEVNGKPEFFRGCPPEWKDVSFEGIRLSDGRVASGRRLDGKVSTSFR